MPIRKLSVYAAMVCLGLGVAGAAPAQETMKPSTAMKVLMDDDAKDFFETAASSNMLEIEAAKLAEAKANDPRTRAYAEQMTKDHTKAGEELAELARKKGVTLPTQLLRRHEGMLKPLRDKQGAEFDDDYRKVMIASHKEAVSLFDEMAKDAKDPEIKAFAVKTLPKLQAHGGMAKQLPEN